MHVCRETLFNLICQCGSPYLWSKKQAQHSCFIRFQTAFVVFIVPILLVVCWSVDLPHRWPMKASNVFRAAHPLLLITAFLGALENLRSNPIPIPEGASYHILVRYYVQRDIVTGLQYEHTVHRGPLRGELCFRIVSVFIIYLVLIPTR